jgi:hypothetical protein
MKQLFTLFLSALAMPVMAEEARHLDVHEHGRGEIDIAIDGTSVAIAFRAPGADLLGFEYAAKSAKDRAAVDAVVATLAKPLELFVLTDAAACSVVEASVKQLLDGTHDKHVAHDDHAENASKEHEATESHSEFRADYLLACDSPEAIVDMTFSYFEVFPNTRELLAQIVTASGVGAFEVVPENPVLDLRSML